jgi:hypothetical protein
MKIHHGGGSAGHPAEKPRQQLQQGDPEVQRYCRGVLARWMAAETPEDRAAADGVPGVHDRPSRHITSSYGNRR